MTFKCVNPYFDVWLCEIVYFILGIWVRYFGCVKNDRTRVICGEVVFLLGVKFQNWGFLMFFDVIYLVRIEVSVVIYFI